MNTNQYYHIYNNHIIQFPKLHTPTTYKLVESPPSYRALHFISYAIMFDLCVAQNDV